MEGNKTSTIADVAGELKQGVADGSMIQSQNKMDADMAYVTVPEAAPAVGWYFNGTIVENVSETGAMQSAI